jgi:glutathione S-transferase
VANYKLVIGNKNYSSWSLRPWLLMKHRGIAFEELRLPLDTEQFQREIAAYNPARRVPVLCDGMLRIPDTIAIVEYLAERHPDKCLWPRDREARAGARSICAEVHSGLGAMRGALPMNCRAANRHVPMDGEIAQDIERVRSIWQNCRETYGDKGPWLFGEFSIADAFFAPVASRFQTYGVPVGPAGQDFVDRILSLPAARRWYEAAESEAEVIAHEEVGLQS